MTRYTKAILPSGFKANGVSAGIKRNGKLDIALFFSGPPAKAAALFTTNRVQAAPLIVGRKQIKAHNNFHGIVVNSGNANCFTGAQGIRDTQETAATVAAGLGVRRDHILVSSTGVIGKRLPIDKIKSAIPHLIAGLSSAGLEKASKAIMTTDTFPKAMTVRIPVGNKTITICGVAKGAGMIAPHMATMLCFIMTDADISRRALRKALQMSVESSFNCITVDGCMSTNDTVAILANAACGNRPIDAGHDFVRFLQGLQAVCLGLAKMIVCDAEGATKFVQIRVNNARSIREAKIAASAIANSALFKTALYGQSPNIYGRIVAGIGAAGIYVDEKSFKLRYSPLQKRGITIDVYLRRGRFSAVLYTSDLTPEYVKINAEYN